MRRSAAALLARSRDPAPSLPPPPKGLEAVKAAATAAVQAVDAKLAAVRATVAGGRATHQPGSGSAAADRHGGAMHRSGSDPELQHRTADNAAANILSLLADDSDEVAAYLPSRRRQARISSCPSLFQASPAGEQPAVRLDLAKPQSQKQLGVVVVGDGAGGGGIGAAGQAAPVWPDAGDWAGRLSPLPAVEQRRPWRQWPTPALRPLQPGAVACGGGDDDRGWAGDRAQADAGDDGKSEAGRLSPRRPGPMLAGRTGR